MDRIELMFAGNIECAIVGHELHKDGNSHLHAFIKCKEKVSINSATQLNVLAAKQGNYQSVRKELECIKYITKDNDYIQLGINVSEYLEAALAKRSTKSGTIAQMLRDGASMHEVENYDPGFYLLHQKAIAEMYTLIANRQIRLGRVDWVIPSSNDTMNDADKYIRMWLAINIKKPSEFKQRQLYVYGPPNTGKTTLLLTLEKYLAIYYIPDEDFYDDYFDGMYDLAVIDEFKGGKTIQFLNKWLQGSKMTLRKKGSQYVKRQALPTIILSNFSVEQVYMNAIEKHQAAVDSLLTRLMVVMLRDPMTPLDPTLLVNRENALPAFVQN